MRRLIPIAAAFLLSVAVGGCSYTWQPNASSQAMDINPFAGSSWPVIAPANGPGYMNGDPQDMRTKR
jgi:hypothetical protein